MRKSEGAISRNEDVCEESGSRCLPSCSGEAKALSSPWRTTRGTLDTRRRNRSGINDDEIARGFIYFVRVLCFVALFFLSRPLDWESQESRAVETRWNALKAGEKYTNGAPYVYLRERLSALEIVIGDEKCIPLEMSRRCASWRLH